METHPGTITVGRAVTAQFVPHRPDYHDAVQQAGLAEGRGQVGGQNSWIIETLQLGDVMVVDIFGKIKDGTVVGDNLGTAVRSRSRAGAVIDGGIRDYQGLVQLEDVNFYVRGVDPTAIADVTLAGLNIPIRIGGATVLPGDVVLGTPTGVIFIPPHLAQEVVERLVGWLLREMRTPEGGFAASLDADSLDAQGTLREGAFYVWNPDQLVAELGEQDGQFAAAAFGVTSSGTFEHGASTLRFPDGTDRGRLADVRARLLTARERRTAPGRDDKVVAAWNGWLIDSLATAAMVFERPDWWVQQVAEIERGER